MFFLIGGYGCYNRSDLAELLVWCIVNIFAGAFTWDFNHISLKKIIVHSKNWVVYCIMGI